MFREVGTGVADFDELRERVVKNGSESVHVVGTHAGTVVDDEGNRWIHCGR